MHKYSKVTRLLVSALATAISCQVLAGNPEKNDLAATTQPLSTASAGFLPLTLARGLMGSEITGHGAKLATSALDESQASPVLAYAEIDSLASGLFPETLDAIKTAVDRGLPVLIESDSWDIARVRAFVQANFPTADTSEIENTAVLIWKTKDQITVKNADHTQVQMLAGIPFNQTMEGKLASTSTALAKAARIHWTVKFAEKAFEATPTDGDYKLTWNNDVVDVWAKKTAPKDKCVVSWRGSNSLGDWLRNLQSQVFVPIAIDGIPTNAGKGASGFVDRLHNLDNDIRRELSESGCKNIIVTGHSLGGAMAQLFTLQLLHNADFNVTDMRAYNPPRTGDETAQATFQSKRSQLESGYGIYCRNGDPVGPIPFGFVRFGPTTPGEYACTMWAPRVAWFNLPANHDLSLW